MEYIEPIAGVSFRPREVKLLLQTLPDGYKVALLPEPSNKFDPFALQIIDPASEAHLGYVPRSHSQIFATDLLEGREISARIFGRSSPPLIQYLITDEHPL